MRDTIDMAREAGLIVDANQSGFDAVLALAAPVQKLVAWVPVTETLLHEQHAWLYETMWIAMKDGRVLKGRYEWRQGRKPDRFYSDCAGDEWAYDASHVMPLQAPAHPSTTPPAAQPAEVTNLAAAIEYADARWSGVDVPIEWARHFADAIGKPYTTPPAAPVPMPADWFAGMPDEYRKEALRIATPPAQPAPVPLTDEQIQDVLTEAVRAGEVSWLGYKLDAAGFYTIPSLSPQHYQIFRAAEQAHGITAAPEKGHP